MKIYTVMTVAYGKKSGVGGWAASIFCGEKIKVLRGGELQTTYLRMELTAIIKSLQFFEEPANVVIISNNEYLINCIQRRMYVSWPRRRWKTKAGKEVENQDLWEILIPLLEKHNVFMSRGYNKTDAAKQAAKEVAEMAQQAS